MIVAIDFGITNTDVALSNKSQYKFFSMPSKNANESFIDEIISLIDIDITEISQIVVTGGKSKYLITSRATSFLIKSTSFTSSVSE